MLIHTDRLSADDLKVWARLSMVDSRLAAAPDLAAKEAQAIADIREFVSTRPDSYMGVSWGKDSVVCAHLLWRARVEVPVVWVVVRPTANPFCFDVRDNFVRRFSVDYHEVLDDRRWAPDDATARWTGWADAHPRGWRHGFDMCEARFGRNHLSGVRGEENGTRERRMLQWGVSSPHTCAPIGHWSGVDVFSYLAKYGLPVHPGYAMSFGGRLDRIRLRVDALGGWTGTGTKLASEMNTSSSAMMRNGHEAHYYAPEVAELWRIRRPQCASWLRPWGPS